MALFNKISAAPQQKSADFALLPNHVGIIMDGNGRWAKKRGLPRSAGHKAGAEVFRTISKACGRIGIPYVTFYAFSTENWKRSPEEVDALMRLFKDYLLEAQADISQAGNIRLKFIGSREGISDELLQLMDQGERDTAANTGTTVYVAINYGGAGLRFGDSSQWRAAAVQLPSVAGGVQRVLVQRCAVAGLYGAGSGRSASRL